MYQRIQRQKKTKNKKKSIRHTRSMQKKCFNLGCDELLLIAYIVLNFSILVIFVIFVVLFCFRWHFVTRPETKKKTQNKMH